MLQPPVKCTSLQKENTLTNSHGTQTMDGGKKKLHIASSDTPPTLSYTTMMIPGGWKGAERARQAPCTRGKAWSHGSHKEHTRALPLRVLFIL